MSADIKKKHKCYLLITQLPVLFHLIILKYFVFKLQSQELVYGVKSVGVGKKKKIILHLPLISIP